MRKSVRSGIGLLCGLAVSAGFVSSAVRLSARGQGQLQDAGVPHRTLQVSPGDFQKVIAQAKPGDIIVLAEGEWPNVTFTIEKGGIQGNPLKIRAKTPGKTIFTGSSSLEIAAPYVSVEGLLFQKGAIKKGTVIRFSSHDGSVRNCAILDYNPANLETQYYWVFFSGDNNRLDRSYFKGKSNMGPLIGNDLAGSRHNSVTGCYFKDIPYRKANGREIMRIWGYGKYGAMGEEGSYFTIEGNLFDHSDGEGQEIISLKSNHNRVIRNTILGTRGGIVLRGGNDNTVSDNIILGQGATKSYGVRIAGQHHIVEHNYISNCDHGIDILCGDYIKEDLTGSYVPKTSTDALKIRVPTYGQVKDLHLIGNIIVGNKKSDLEIGGSYKRQWPTDQMVLLPEDCLIASNRFIRPEGGDSVIGMAQDSAAPLNRFTFKSNRYEHNLLLGGAIAFAPSAAGFLRQDLPKGWSEIKERTGFKPLTPSDVGPDWVK
jgi:poly(beta-D-mannuronate) lyase